MTGSVAVTMLELWSGENEFRGLNTIEIPAAYTVHGRHL